MSAKPKILIDLLKLDNLFVGLGQVSLQYGLAIADLAKQQPDVFEIDFLVPPDFVNYFGDAIGYKTAKSFSRYFFFSNKGYDVWHSIHQDSGYLPAAGTKYLLTIHDLNFLKEKTSWKAKRRLAALQKKINRAYELFAISNFSAKEIEANLNLQNKKVEVIYNGVESLSDVEAAQPVFIRLLQKLHFSDLTLPSPQERGGEFQKKSDDSEKPFLFSLANITARKNIAVLLPMMKHLPSYNLIISGDTQSEYAAALIKQVVAEKLTNVFISGKVNPAEKAWLMQHCTAFVFPSLIEGFGLPVVEAMSCGKPVFVANATSLPEIAGELGFYFENFEPEEMANLILEKLNFVKQQPDFSTQLKNHAAKFSWKKNAAAYWKVYEELLLKPL